MLRYLAFPALARDLSVLVLGTDAFREVPSAQAYAVLDAWLELKGNVIDTGREYGAAEHVIGRWLRDRGLGDEVVLVTKGAHPDTRWRSRLTRAAIRSDLLESIAALGRDVIDVYLVHRDDERASVGPILEELNEHRQAGRIRVFGASNWTCARLEEAEAYATDHGLDSFACSSPGLSLAVPREAPWPGTVGAHARESRTWYEERRFPVLAWSAQAGGFFASVQNDHVRRVYVNDGNRERQRRAESLAGTRGCTANQVALAWVLHQSFPVYAIIGPRTVEELWSSVQALDVELTPDEIGWLNLEELDSRGKDKAT